MPIYARRVRISHVRKNRLLWVFLFLAFLATTLITVGRANAAGEGRASVGAATAGIGFSIEPAGDTLEISVFDESTGQALPDAQIDVSRGTGVEAGAGESPTIVTVRRDGYTAFTLAGARAGNLRVYLKPLPPETAGAEVRGNLGGWKTATFGAVKAGVVLRSLSAMDLLHFNLDSILSPWRDTIDIAGPREIPSNVVIPRQSLYTPLGPITIDKPLYRLPLETGAVTRLVGVQGEAQVMDLMEAFQGGNYSVDLLNKLSFRRVGVSRELTAGGVQRVDFNATHDLAPRHRVSVTRPPFSADVLVVAASDLSGNRRALLPTDVKTAINKDKPWEVRQVQLAAPTQSMGTGYVVSVAVAERGMRVSGILDQAPGSSVSPGEFLDGAVPQELAALPESVTVRAPERGLGVLVFEYETGESRTAPAWMVFALPSAGEVRVPTGSLGMKLKRVSDIDLDLGPDFQEDRLESGTALTKLRRFARTTHQILD